MNFREETLGFIKECGYSESDVDYVSDGESWETFEEFLNQVGYGFIYDCGYGCPEINTRLEIVLHDGAVIRRHEYDGSEWWELFKVNKPSVHGKLAL